MSTIVAKPVSLNPLLSIGSNCVPVKSQVIALSVGPTQTIDHFLTTECSASKWLISLENSISQIASFTIYCTYDNDEVFYSIYAINNPYDINYNISISKTADVVYLQIANLSPYDIIASVTSIYVPIINNFMFSNTVLFTSNRVTMMSGFFVSADIIPNDVKSATWILIFEDIITGEHNLMQVTWANDQFTTHSLLGNTIGNFIANVNSIPNIGHELTISNTAPNSNIIYSTRMFTTDNNINIDHCNSSSMVWKPQYQQLMPGMQLVADTITIPNHKGANWLITIRDIDTSVVTAFELCGFLDNDLKYTKYAIIGEELDIISSVEYVNSTTCIVKMVNNTPYTYDVHMVRIPVGL